ADKAHDLIGGPQWPDLEEGVAIRHQADCPAHVERRGAFTRDDGEQLFLAAICRITRVRRQDWGHFVDAGGKVREEPLRHRGRLFLRVGEIVDGTIAAVDLPAAQLLLAYVVPHRVAHHRRAGHEQLRNVTHHHGEMTEDRLRRADTHHTTQQQVDYRH